MDLSPSERDQLRALAAAILGAFARWALDKWFPDRTPAPPEPAP